MPCFLLVIGYKAGGCNPFSRLITMAEQGEEGTFRAG